MIYREFSVRCTTSQLLRLSDWLNDNLDFAAGEGFGKIADSPREDFELCKTDAKIIAGWLEQSAWEWSMPENIRKQDAARRMRLMAAKLKKKIENK